MVLGDQQIQVTRSVPGRILSQGISTSLDGYFAGSLQRKACLKVEAAVSDEVEILEARGVLVEDLPDAKGPMVCCKTDELKSLAVASRNVLKQLGLDKAELKRTTPLKFACGRDARGVERRGAQVASADHRHHLPHVRQDLYRQGLNTEARRRRGVWKEELSSRSI